MATLLCVSSCYSRGAYQFGEAHNESHPGLENAYPYTVSVRMSHREEPRHQLGIGYTELLPPVVLIGLHDESRLKAALIAHAVAFQIGLLFKLHTIIAELNVTRLAWLIGGTPSANVTRTFFGIAFITHRHA